MNRLRIVACCIGMLPGIWACDGEDSPKPDAIVSDVVETAGGDEAFDTAAPDADATPELPPFSPGGCGMPAYDWLPRDQVGQIVFQEEDASWLLPPETLDAMLAEVGFEAFSPLPYGSRLFRIRYTTQDRGVVREATTLVGIPQPTDGSAGTYPTVLWLHGTTGFNDGCAPSRGLDGAAGAVLMAALGYIGVAPDYLGMAGFGGPSGIPHPYLVGEPTAIASLDAVRAAYALLESGVLTDEPARPDGRLVPWGASQGGHAALWVDRMAGLYAPEMELTATLALIPPAELTGEAEAALAAGGEGIGNFAGFLTAAMRWYGSPQSLAGVLTDADPKHYATAVPEVMDTVCGTGGLFDGLDRVNQLYEQAFLDQIDAVGMAGLDPWGCYFRENSLTTTTWPRVQDSPVLFVLSQNDELVNEVVERAAFGEMCGEGGYRMQLIECAGARHSEGAAWSLPEQRDWIRARLAGTPLPAEDTCVLTDPVRCSAQP